jgi:hypothetical protein
MENKIKWLCTRDLYFEDGILAFKKGRSYEQIDIHTDVPNWILVFVNESGETHSVTKDGWGKYFTEIKEKGGN